MMRIVHVYRKPPVPLPVFAPPHLVTSGSVDRPVVCALAVDLSIVVDIFLNFNRYQYDKTRTLITDYRVLRMAYIKVRAPHNILDCPPKIWL